ncbi:hypothetical protein [Dyadobacter fanqingshengii]|uniref:Uncharacterized protein n=1 Tax=Dyadobacter fanqingshengii TaxID=2906443 RepID=A0A9X1PHY4_9BACT|nr:hypothetical protein [Dyadobacter fanqingshengii]MCF0043662.1 hypothetical protein [Dyadobacter fanqingshengii]USJ34722.1 hypothetical protein NFI81_18665 [Dyadobacter fanqingshengii]
MDKTIEGLKLFENVNDINVMNLPLPDQVRITPLLIHLERIGFVKNHYSNEDIRPIETGLTYPGIQARNKQFSV